MTPKGLLERVELRKDCEGYFRTFTALSDTRNYNQAGLQPLQPSEILKYLADGLGISGGERTTKFLHLILELDRQFMNDHFAKASEGR